MNPGALRRLAVDWTSLPAELLAIISGSIGGPMEKVRFRSVCKSWRISTPLKTNKLSPLCPLKSPEWKDFFGVFNEEMEITASAVYLIRPRSDPSKAWLVSLHEPEDGKLVLRNVLLDKELDGGNHPDLEPDRIVATQTLIFRIYTHNLICQICEGILCCTPVNLICESGSRFGNLFAFCTCYPGFAFRLDWRSGKGEATELALDSKIVDFVDFKGLVFGVSASGFIYFFDQRKLEMIQMTYKPVREILPDSHHLRRFLVCEGELYLVWISYADRDRVKVYKLQVIVDDEDDEERKCGGIVVEQVKDLGDKAFFVTFKYCFSVSAQLLPPPWKGNCVFMARFSFCSCKCPKLKVWESRYDQCHQIYNMEDQTLVPILPKDGYFDLFSTPTSFVHYSSP